MQYMLVLFHCFEIPGLAGSATQKSCNGLGSKANTTQQKVIAAIRFDRRNCLAIYNTKEQKLGGAKEKKDVLWDDRIDKIVTIYIREVRLHARICAWNLVSNLWFSWKDCKGPSKQYTCRLWQRLAVICRNKTRIRG